MVRVIGRLGDLARHRRRDDERTLQDVDVRWSFEGNAAWLADGVRRGEPFLQISPAAAGSVLAWELARIAEHGYVRAGPFWVPALWQHDGDAYRRVVRLVAAHVLAGPADPEPHYVPKALAELEPLLDLWPHVVALPVTVLPSLDDLVLGRAVPVHPLGVVAAPAHADGRTCSPAEFFCHDVDHARFKVREELLARGVAVPDAYTNGSTWDTARGAHRTFLPAARGAVDASAWRLARLRLRAISGLLARLAARPGVESVAARWLLGELLHEKGLPVDATVLARELATPRHVDKLARKLAAGFYADAAPGPDVVAALPRARVRLAELVAAGW